MSDRKHNQDGAVLLFAMLLLLVMITIGVVLASLIYREIIIAREFPNSLQAYYAAESGIEQNLDIIAARRVRGSLLDTTASNDDVIDRITSGGVTTMANNAQFSIDTTETTGSVNEVEFVVPYRNGSQIELYDPDDISNGIGAGSLRLSWNQGVCEESTSQQVEVDTEELDPTNPLLTNQFDPPQLVTCSIASPDPEYTCMHVSNDINITKNYLVRVAPFDCSIPKMRVQFYDRSDPDADLDLDGEPDGQIVPIPSIIRMTSVGEAGRSQRRITATTNWIPHASGLSDFVVFSIEPIVKGSGEFTAQSNPPGPGG